MKNYDYRAPSGFVNDLGEGGWSSVLWTSFLSVSNGTRNNMKKDTGVCDVFIKMKKQEDWSSLVNLFNIVFYHLNVPLRKPSSLNLR